MQLCVQAAVVQQAVHALYLGIVTASVGGKEPTATSVYHEQDAVSTSYMYHTVDTVITSPLRKAKESASVDPECNIKSVH